MSFMASGEIMVDARRYLRYPVEFSALLSGPDGAELTVRVVEISGGGARVLVPGGSEELFLGPGWLLTVPRFGCYEATRAWRRGDTIGVHWILAEGEQAHLANRLAQLLPPPPSTSGLGRA